MNAVQAGHEMRLDALEKRAEQIEKRLDLIERVNKARDLVARSDGKDLSVIGRARSVAKDLSEYIERGEARVKELRQAKALLEESNG